MCLSIHRQVSRIDKLRRTAADFLLTAVPLDCFVGIVTFSSRASIKASLTKITDEHVRETLETKLPNTVGGYTAIGKGLQKGVQVFNATYS